MARSKKKIGEIMVLQKACTPEQVKTALGMQEGQRGKRLGEIMVDAGLAKEEDVAKALARQYRIQYVDVSDEQVQSQVEMDLVPEDLVRKHLILPIGKERGRLLLVIHDPMNLELMDMLRFRLNTEIEPRIGARGKIKMFLDQQGGSRPSMVSEESLVTASIDKSIDKSVDKSVDSSIDQAAESAPIIKLVSRMIAEAVEMRASDIHVEPMEDRVRLRYRIDGVCIERDNLPKRMQNAVLARFKLMAGMNIAEKRIPQDGRIKMPVGESVIDFRVSACPAYHGESIVLRILRPDSVRIGLVNLGFEPDSLEHFNRIIKRPNGIFLVTGPTGSGKTTTLYSALDVLNRPGQEDHHGRGPGRVQLRPGINQCQVREGDRADVRKSILRVDAASGAEHHPRR